MPRFNLNDYDEVKDRIPLFYDLFPDGRITADVINEDNTGVTIKAYLWKNAEEQAANTPLSTGLAREVPGGHIDKYTENGETRCNWPGTGKQKTYLERRERKPTTSQ